VLWPPAFNRLIDTALRLARRQPMPQPLSFGGVVRAAGWSLLMWLLCGVHRWALLRDLGAGGPDRLLVAPAGAGPRGVAPLMLLAGVLPSAPATVAAMVSRLLMTVGDLDWSDVAVPAERLRKRSRARRAAPGPRL
jgi:glycosyltransferase 2 family protein